MTESEIAKIVALAALFVHRTLGGLRFLEAVARVNRLPLFAFLRLCVFAPLR